uniref:MFS transporter n=1 Tax=Pseudonocardia pini TaxID=2758030 RepID=UPI0015F02A86
MNAGTTPVPALPLAVTLSGLVMALMTATLSTTIITTALPTVLADLGGGQIAFVWVVTATLLATTATAPLWGRLADLVAGKLLLQVALTIYLVGSLLAGLAPSIGVLIAARGMQGIGLGGVQALVQVVLGVLIPPRRRGRYTGWISAASIVATVSGPLVGGLLTETPGLGWRWCFLVAVPVVLLCQGVLQWALRLPVHRREVTIDYLGSVLVVAATSLVLVWISFVGDSYAFLSWQTLVALPVALLLLVGLVVVERRVRMPVVPLGLLRRRSTAIAVAGAAGLGPLLLLGATFVVPYLQVARSYSPTEAGLMLLPMSAGSLVATTVGGRITSRTGRVRPVLLTGFAVLTLAVGMLAIAVHLGPRGHAAWLLGGMIALGVGLGLTVLNITLSVQNEVGLSDLGAATSAVNFFRNIGGSIGVVVIGALLADRRDVLVGQGRSAAEALGTATAQAFLAVVALTALVLALMVALPRTELRETVDGKTRAKS